MDDITRGGNPTRNVSEKMWKRMEEEEDEDEDEDGRERRRGKRGQRWIIYNKLCSQPWRSGRTDGGRAYHSTMTPGDEGGCPACSHTEPAPPRGVSASLGIIVVIHPPVISCKPWQLESPVGP